MHFYHHFRHVFSASLRERRLIADGETQRAPDQSQDMVDSNEFTHEVKNFSEQVQQLQDRTEHFSQQRRDLLKGSATKMEEMIRKMISNANIATQVQEKNGTTRPSDFVNNLSRKLSNKHGSHVLSFIPGTQGITVHSDLSSFEKRDDEYVQNVDQLMRAHVQNIERNGNRPEDNLQTLNFHANDLLKMSLEKSFGDKVNSLSKERKDEFANRVVEQVKKGLQGVTVNVQWDGNTINIVRPEPKKPAGQPKGPENQSPRPSGAPPPAEGSRQTERGSMQPSVEKETKASPESKPSAEPKPSTGPETKPGSPTETSSEGGKKHENPNETYGEHLTNDVKNSWENVKKTFSDKNADWFSKLGSLASLAGAGWNYVKGYVSSIFDGSWNKKKTDVLKPPSTSKPESSEQAKSAPKTTEKPKVRDDLAKLKKEELATRKKTEQNFLDAANQELKNATPAKEKAVADLAKAKTDLEKQKQQNASGPEAQKLEADVQRLTHEVDLQTKLEAGAKAAIKEAGENQKQITIAEQALGTPSAKPDESAMQPEGAPDANSLLPGVDVMKLAQSLSPESKKALMGAIDDITKDPELASSLRGMLPTLAQGDPELAKQLPLLELVMPVVNGSPNNLETHKAMDALLNSSELEKFPMTTTERVLLLGGKAALSAADSVSSTDVIGINSFFAGKGKAYVYEQVHKTVTAKYNEKITEMSGKLPLSEQSLRNILNAPPSNKPIEPQKVLAALGHNGLLKLRPVVAELLTKPEVFQAITRLPILQSNPLFQTVLKTVGPDGLKELQPLILKLAMDPEIIKAVLSTANILTPKTS